ncbi:aldehyde dehydrogenase family protein [Mycolicibacterium diernhoferi]|uniref:aldehyde dehydrogenase (NAD(+)) n=1 Tax=Mycolicibacterium diernhoferi TaxID=1801 RepID=A0A2A7NS77_9MYCO|nr:aldehyde dehydrogenase family protein [Mycolicibacterium diernhoferi]QYL23781.1 aldehyde dehydrogenase family protein [Mycolicibacterium diernhoferi]
MLFDKEVNVTETVASPATPTIAHERQQFINGEWVSGESSELIDVVNPATEEIIAQVPAGTAGDVDRAVAAAKAAFESWSRTPVAERLRILEAVVEGYQAREDDLVRVISMEMGAPESFSRAAQVPLPLMTMTTAVEILRDFKFEYEANGVSIVREPIGVIGAITPWNFPLHQVALKVIPGLATGCTVVLKPSEVTPLSSIIFTEVLEAAGVPAGVFNLVQGHGPEVGEAISSHPDIDLVSFTGSTRAGKRVTELGAQTVKRVTLELGGKSANIILDDADFEAAIPAGVAGSYLNCGQACNAPTRMLVPRARLAEVEELAKKAAETFEAGAATEGKTPLGPVTTEAGLHRVRRYIEQGVEEGAKLIAGGAEPVEGPGYFVRPTVFSNVTQDMTIAREEIFGPVLSIIAYDTVDEAVAIANDSEYGLGGWVWSGDATRAREVAKRIRTGQVYINGAGIHPYAPFGGYKQSGNGREWGLYGFEEVLETKAILG